MPLWDQLKARTQTANRSGPRSSAAAILTHHMNGQLKTRTDQLRNKDFASASMAMCALIAAADGSIEASERQKTAALISNNDVLAIFPAEELRLDERGGNARLCAIALLEGSGGELNVRREVRYINGSQSALDQAYGWGLNWARGRK